MTATEHQAEAKREARAREFETLRALLAMSGHELLQLPDDSFLCKRWGWPPRALADLDAVRAFTKLVGAYADESNSIPY